jgi:lipopolysaccharide/colanic/teichoic acid biosynthesis glycosyltransferase
MKKREAKLNAVLSNSERRLPIWKRILDVTLILFLSPGWLLLGAIVAVLVKVSSPGPVFFGQRRVGYKGKEFICFKFRTMSVQAVDSPHRRHVQELIRSQNPMVKLDAQDPRVAPLGRLLRVSGLDELPQLLNVLKGEMSLVGPRPCVPYECEEYQPWHWRRFEAVPGLTGLWQVSGKNRTTFDEMVTLDIDYSHRLSLWLDLQILMKTVPALWDQYSDLRPTPPRQLRSSARSAKWAECYGS